MKTLEQLINEADETPGGTNETHKGGVLPKDVKKAYRRSKDNDANVSNHPHGRWVTYHFGPAEVVRRQRKWRRPDYTKKNRWRKGENSGFNSEYASPITFIRRDKRGKKLGYKRIYGMTGRNKFYDGDNKKANLTDLMFRQEWIHWWVPAKGETRHPEWKHNQNRARGVSERKFKEEDKNEYINSVNFTNFYQMIPGLVNKKGEEGEKQKYNALAIYQFLRYNARANAFRAKHPDARTNEYYDPKLTPRRRMLGKEWDSEAAAKVGVLSYTDADGESLIPLLRKQFNLTPAQCRDLKKAVDRFNEDARRRYADNHRYVGKRRGKGAEATEPLFTKRDKNGKLKPIQRTDAKNKYVSGSIKPMDQELDPEVVIPNSGGTKKEREKMARLKNNQAKMHAADAEREAKNTETANKIKAKKRAKAVEPYHPKSKETIHSPQVEVLPPQPALGTAHRLKGKEPETIDVTPERRSIGTGPAYIAHKGKLVRSDGTAASRRSGSKTKDLADTAVTPEVLEPVKSLAGKALPKKKSETIDVTPERKAIDAQNAIENKKRAIRKAAKAIEASVKAIQGRPDAVLKGKKKGETKKRRSVKKNETPSTTPTTRVRRRKKKQGTGEDGALMGLLKNNKK